MIRKVLIFVITIVIAWIGIISILALVPSATANDSSEPILHSTPILNYVNGSLIPSPKEEWQNHWWIVDYWTGPQGGDGSIPMGGSFIAIDNTFSNLEYGTKLTPPFIWYDLVFYLPLNVAFGTSPDNCVWFQFAVQFVNPNAGWPYPSSVTWTIWDIKGPGTNPRIYPFGDYHYTEIGLPYVVGHEYYWSISAYRDPSTDEPEVIFYIRDENTGQSWSTNNWVWDIPSTNILYDYSLFSPASAVEGYTTNPTLNDVPYFQSRVGYDISSLYHVESYETPEGITTAANNINNRLWYWEMLTPNELPVPNIISVNYPSSIKFGDYATIEVKVKNNGGTASWQTIAISFPPEQPLPDDIIIEKSDISARIWNPGETVSALYSTLTTSLKTYLVEGSTLWNHGDTHYLRIKVKPKGPELGSFTFFVKSVAAKKNWASNWTPKIGESDGPDYKIEKDQQSEIVRAYKISISDDDTTPPSWSSPSAEPSALNDAYGGYIRFKVKWFDYSGISEVKFEFWYDSTHIGVFPPTGSSIDANGNGWYWYDMPRAQWISYVGHRIRWISAAWDNDNDRPDDRASASTSLQDGPFISDDDTTGPSFSSPTSTGDIYDNYAESYRIDITVTDSSGVYTVKFRYRFDGSWSPWYSASGSSGDHYWYDIPRSEWIKHVGSTIYFQVYAEDNDNDRTDDRASSKSDEYIAGKIMDDDTIGPNIFDVMVSEYNGDGDGIIEDDEKVKISDPSGIYSTSCTVDGISPPVEDTYFVIVDHLPPGDYSFTIRATDNDYDGWAGDRASSSVSGSFIVYDDDSTPPTGSNAQPPDGQTYYSDYPEDIRIQVTWSDDTGISDVLFYYRYNGTTWIEKSPSGQSGNTYWYDIPRSEWTLHIGEEIQWYSKAWDSDSDCGRTDDQLLAEYPSHPFKICLLERVPPMPDLTITNVWWDPEYPVEGDTITIYITEANIGDADAGPHTDRVRVNTQPTDFPDPGLAAGTSRTFQFTISNAVTGIYHIKVILDVNNDVLEKNETNNVWEGDITVAGWVPYVPTAEQTEIEISTIGGVTYAKVTLTFPDTGYRVKDWGTISRTNNDFSVDALVERWTGVSSPTVTQLSHTYELGKLPPDTYTFTFMAWGTIVESEEFTIAPPVPGVEVSIDPKTASVELKHSVEYAVYVNNTGGETDTYDITVEGIDPSWYSLSATSVTVEPGQKVEVTLTITPPCSALTYDEEETYLFTVNATSQTDSAIWDAADAELTVYITWEYIYEDPVRHTILKISTDNKCFRFITPDKDFGIRQASSMYEGYVTVYYDGEYVDLPAAIIRHNDGELRLLAYAGTEVPFCYARAVDYENGNRYMLRVDPTQPE